MQCYMHNVQIPTKDCDYPKEIITCKTMRNCHLDYIVMPTWRKISLGQMMTMFVLWGLPMPKVFSLSYCLKLNNYCIWWFCYIPKQHPVA